MKNKILLFVAAVLLFAGCENMVDDRQRPVPENPTIAWLLSVEVDKLPKGIDAYSCVVFNIANPEQNHTFLKTDIKLPELLKIVGAQRLDEEKYAVSFFKCDMTGGNVEVIATFEIPSFGELKANPDGLQQKIRIRENGVDGYLNIRYD